MREGDKVGMEPMNAGLHSSQDTEELGREPRGSVRECKCSGQHGCLAMSLQGRMDGISEPDCNL